MTVDGYPSPEIQVARLANMPTADARAELARILDLSRGYTGPDFRDALAWNAELVTGLRKRGVRLWGLGDAAT